MIGVPSVPSQAFTASVLWKAVQAHATQQTLALLVLSIVGALYSGPFKTCLTDGYDSLWKFLLEYRSQKLIQELSSAQKNLGEARIENAALCQRIDVLNKQLLQNQSAQEFVQAQSESNKEELLISSILNQPNQPLLVELEGESEGDSLSTDWFQAIKGQWKSLPYELTKDLLFPESVEELTSFSPPSWEEEEGKFFLTCLEQCRQFLLSSLVPLEA